MPFRGHFCNFASRHPRDLVLVSNPMFLAGVETELVENAVVLGRAGVETELVEKAVVSGRTGVETELV